MQGAGRMCLMYVERQKRGDLSTVPVGKCLEPRDESCAVLLNLVDQKMGIQILHRMKAYE